MPFLLDAEPQTVGEDELATAVRQSVEETLNSDLKL
jgi:hypothetical protein